MKLFFTAQEIHGRYFLWIMYNNNIVLNYTKGVKNVKNTLFYHC